MLLPPNQIEIVVKSDVNSAIINLFLAEKVCLAAPTTRFFGPKI